MKAKKCCFEGFWMGSDENFIFGVCYCRSYVDGEIERKHSISECAGKATPARVRRCIENIMKEMGYNQYITGEKER